MEHLTHEVAAHQQNICSSFKTNERKKQKPAHEKDDDEKKEGMEKPTSEDFQVFQPASDLK